MSLLELIMIVKNSGDILRKCLQHNKKYIDRWTILDTGSTDNTPDIINEELGDIPGKLHFSDFVDFSTARNKAFDLASNECKYRIVLDDSYTISNGEALRNHLQTSNKDLIHCKIVYDKYNNGVYTNVYEGTRITKTSSKLRYIYRVHEALDIPKKCKMEYIDETQFCIIDHLDEKHSERTENRLKRDIELLLLDKKEYNDPRSLFYLTRTYVNMNKPKDVIKYAKELLQMTNIKEYTFYAEYTIILCDFVETKDKNTYYKKLNDLQKRHLNRIEPSYKIACFFYDENKINVIEDGLDKLIQIKKPQLSATSYEQEIYEYDIPYMYIDVKLRLGKVDQAVPILKDLLYKNPYDQKLLNMKYSICDNLDISSTRLSPKTLVIHTGITTFTWDPINPSSKVSGSEYMAMFLAKEFRDIGYRVFIFGDFVGKEDYQCTIDGIQYIDMTLFSDFCLTYIVDYLIVSRYIDNLVYYDNVKNVYLWLHDVLPGGDFRYIQIHQQKFKNVICISEWQKRYILKHTQIKEEYIYVSRNAIHPKRFLTPHERTPYRFIWTSGLERGVQNFVDMSHLLKSRYPSSTFYIFGNKEKLSSDVLKTIETTDYIYLSPRVSQSQLAIELQKSDVWLYPTTFPETYCISAVEAMAAGCLVATLKEAALCEIVADRGVAVDPHPEQPELGVKELFETLCSVLDQPEVKKEITERGKKWAMKQDFRSLALDWEKTLFYTFGHLKRRL